MRGSSSEESRIREYIPEAGDGSSLADNTTDPSDASTGDQVCPKDPKDLKHLGKSYRIHRRDLIYRSARFCVLAFRIIS